MRFPGPHPHRHLEISEATGISAFVSTVDQPYNLVQAIGGTQRLLEAGTEHVMRIVAVGGSLATAAAWPLQPVPAND